MSNVCCALCNVVVKTPDDPMTRRPHPWCRTIWSSGHFVSGSFYNFIEHRTTDIRHLTSLGSRHLAVEDNVNRRSTRKRHIARIVLRALLGFLFSTLTGTALWAQAVSTAQITGTVKDQSGAVLPGAEIKATQTATGAVRTAVSAEDGGYVLTNLAIGPYTVEVSLPGFRTYVQAGIVLQVGSNPAVNAVLQVGQVTEAIEVQADAAMVETQSTGLGTVIDNKRVLELPLNGRNAAELIFLSGMANVAGPASNALRTLAPYPANPVSVAGGVGTGVLFLLDGTVHLETHTALNLPLPFPDALQEFKVETSALPAQYG